MEKVKYRYNRWRLALGRLVNLRYINRWIIFCADLFISLCVSLQSGCSASNTSFILSNAI